MQPAGARSGPRVTIATVRPAARRPRCPTRAAAQTPRSARPCAQRCRQLRELPKRRPRATPAFRNGTCHAVLGTGLHLPRDAWYPRGVRTRGFVFEHIIVMEAAARASPVPGRGVHHQQRGEGRQSPRKLGTVDQAAADRLSSRTGRAHGHALRFLLATHDSPPPCGWAVINAGGGRDIESPVQSESSLDVLQA